MTDRMPADTGTRHLKAARVRRLTDPLGAMGFRRTGDRIRRERIARRSLLAATVAAFLALAGGLAGSAPAPPADVPADAPMVIWTIDEAGRAQQAQVVDMTPVTHVRTRSS